MSLEATAQDTENGLLHCIAGPFLGVGTVCPSVRIVFGRWFEGAVCIKILYNELMLKPKCRFPDRVAVI